MAFRSYMRFGWIGMAVAATMATTAPTFADNYDPTTATTDIGYGNVIVVSFNNYDRAFDFAPIAIKDERPALASRHSALQSYRPLPIKERASRSAVRPTAIAGWRSGRFRHLAVA